MSFFFAPNKFMTLEEIKRKIMFLKLEIQKLMGKKPDWIICHHGGGDYNLHQVNESHKWWKLSDGSIVPGILSSLDWWVGYQYWINKMGFITQCRHDLEEGAHTLGLNKNSIGICLEGNFNKKMPTTQQLSALKDLIDRKKAEYGLVNRKIEGHKFFANKDCPGHRLYKWLCQNYPT